MPVNTNEAVVTALGNYLSTEIPPRFWKQQAIMQEQYRS
jgi:hypothetical protein